MGISKTLATALLAAIPAAPVAQTPWPQAPGYYRMQLGDFRVTVLSDGSVDRDLPAIMSDPDWSGIAIECSTRRYQRGFRSTAI